MLDLEIPSNQEEGKVSTEGQISHDEETGVIKLYSGDSIDRDADRVPSLLKSLSNKKELSCDIEVQSKPESRAASYDGSQAIGNSKLNIPARNLTLAFLIIILISLISLGIFYLFRCMQKIESLESNESRLKDSLAILQSSVHELQVEHGEYKERFSRADFEGKNNTNSSAQKYEMSSIWNLIETLQTEIAELRNASKVTQSVHPAYQNYANETSTRFRRRKIKKRQLHMPKTKKHEKINEILTDNESEQGSWMREDTFGEDTRREQLYREASVQDYSRTYLAEAFEEFRKELRNNVKKTIEDIASLNIAMNSPRSNRISFEK